MRGPLTVVLASFLSFLLLGSASSGEAHAQKKNVVVEMMKGPMAPRLRIVVTKSLARGGFTVVPDKKLAAIEADLGLIKVSDSYTAVAREVKATAFVAGIVVGGRRPKARVVVRNADGKIIGAQGWQATSLPKLLAAVNATATPKLSGIINGGGGGRAPAPAAPKAESTEDLLAAAEKSRQEARGGRGRGGSAGRGGSGRRSGSAQAQGQGRPTRRPRPTQTPTPRWPRKWRRPPSRRRPRRCRAPV